MKTDFAKTNHGSNWTSPEQYTQQSIINTRYDDFDVQVHGELYRSTSLHLRLIVWYLILSKSSAWCFILFFFQMIKKKMTVIEMYHLYIYINYDLINQTNLSLYRNCVNVWEYSKNIYFLIENRPAVDGGLRPPSTWDGNNLGRE